METIYVIVKSAVVVEDGAATTSNVILPHHGYFKNSDDAVLMIAELNRAWGLEKELARGNWGVSAESWLDRFYTMYGCEPYEYAPVNLHNWEKK